MGQLELPERLARLIPVSSPATGLLSEFLATYEPILTHPKMPFFPGFTDHSVQHVTELLSLAVDLVPEPVWEKGILTAEDAVVFIAGTLLHDIAMHIEPSGFLELVSEKTEHQPILWFAQVAGDQPWSKLWESYLFEIMRWDERYQNRILGQVGRVRIPPREPADWDTFDHLIIGEFLRRYHPRLAHEIALYGFPGLPKTNLPVFSKQQLPIVDLAGVVARSHGIALRTAVCYLDHRHGSVVKPYGIIVTYLMALLRVADYLQIQSERAPLALLHLREPLSPMSRAEWSKHRAVSYVGTDDNDPYCTNIHVNGDISISTLLSLERLLNGIQAELDQTNAVLHEVFARKTQGRLQLLELSKYRVSSNLFNETFRANLPFVPSEICFKVKGYDILELLTNPLYEYRASLGVRELLQNAVDAVNEIDSLITANKVDAEIIHTERISIGTDILIQLRVEEPDSVWLDIKDTGTGMTADILKEYFFTIGASYRRNADWRNNFLDETGHSRVIRSGRFGIGVLAAFMLGHEIEVTTRHYSSQRGLFTKVSLHTNPIEIRMVDGLKVGTTISVKLNDKAKEVLGSRTIVSIYRNSLPIFRQNSILNKSEFQFDNWDWYAMDKPRIKRCTHDGKTIPSLHRVPSPGEDARPLWRRFKHDSGQEVQWSYQSSVQFACNGIIVEDEWVSKRINSFYRKALYDNNISWFSIPWPNISIVDPDGKLPLNLTRTSVDFENVSFKNQLIDEVIRDIIAHTLIHGPRDIDSAMNFERIFSNMYPGLRDLSPWIIFPNGITIADPSLLSTCGTEHFVIVYGVYDKSNRVKPLIENDICKSVFIENSTGIWPNIIYCEKKDEIAEKIAIEFSYHLWEQNWLIKLNKTAKFAVYMTNDVKDHFKKRITTPESFSSYPRPSNWRNYSTIGHLRHIKDDWWALSSDDYVQSDDISQKLNAFKNVKRPIAWVDISLKPREILENTSESSKYKKIWESLIGPTCIEWSSIRHFYMSPTYKELVYYLEAWQQCKLLVGLTTSSSAAYTHYIIGPWAEKPAKDM